MAVGLPKSPDYKAMMRAGQLRDEPAEPPAGMDYKALMRAGQLRDAPLDYSPGLRAPAPTAAPVEEPQVDEERHPWQAGFEGAGSRLGVAMPYFVEKGLSKLGLGDLTPGEEADYLRRLRESGAKQERLLPGGAMNWSDVRDVGGALRWLNENAATSGPESAAGILATLGGGAIGTAIEPGGGTLLGAGLGATAGFTTNLATQVGADVERATQGGKEALTDAEMGRTAAAAPVQAGLETASDLLLPVVGKTVLKPFAKPGAKVVQEGVLASLGRGARKAAVAGAGEAVTEPLQTAGERYVSAETLWDPAARREYADAAITAGVLGTLTGGAVAPFDKDETAPAAPGVERKGNFDPNQQTGSGTIATEGPAPKAAPAAQPKPTPKTGGAAAGYDTQFGSGKYGDANFKASERTMGEVYDYGQNVLRPQTRKAGYGKGAGGEVLGTSAIGKYQMVGGTMADLAKEVYGAGWRDVQFSPEVQETLAKRLFERNKNGNLHAIWEGLPDATPGAYANLTWEQAREVISKHEGTTGSGAFAVADAFQNEARDAGGEEVDLDQLGEDVQQRINLITDPVAAGRPDLAPGVIPGMEDVPDVPAMRADQTTLANELRNEESVGRVRQAIMKDVTGDKETYDPQARFIARLKRAGLDPRVTPEELDALNEDAAVRRSRGIYPPATPEQRQGMVEEAAAIQEALPEQDTTLGVRGREEAPAAAAAPAAQAAPTMPTVAERVGGRVAGFIQGIRDSSPTNRGSSIAVWAEKGAKDALNGVNEPPPGRDTKTWYGMGQDFVGRETREQEREDAEVAARNAPPPSIEGVALPSGQALPEKPSARPKPTKAARAAARTEARKVKTQRAQEAVEAGRKREAARAEASAKQQAEAAAAAAAASKAADEQKAAAKKAKEEKAAKIVAEAKAEADAKKARQKAAREKQAAQETEAPAKPQRAAAERTGLTERTQKAVDAKKPSAATSEADERAAFRGMAEEFAKNRERDKRVQAPDFAKPHVEAAARASELTDAQLESASQAATTAAEEANATGGFTKAMVDKRTQLRKARDALLAERSRRVRESNAALDERLAAHEAKRKATARGSKSKFLDAVVEAEQAKEITTEQGTLLRAMAEADWDQSMWDALDTAISEGQPKPGRKIIPRKAASGAAANQQSLQQRLRREFNRIGLRDVDIELVDKLANEDARAEYLAPDESPTRTHLVRFAMNHDEQLNDMHHEILHVLREMDLISDAEWDALASEAKTDPDRVAHVNSAYAKENALVREEEMVSELYRETVQGRAQPNPTVSRIIAKIRAIFRAIANAFGADQTVTSEQAIERIYSGEVGARRRGFTRGERGVRAGKGIMAQRERRSPIVEVKRSSVARAGRAKSFAARQLAKQGHVYLASTKDLAKIGKAVPAIQDLVDIMNRNYAEARAFLERTAEIKDQYFKLHPKLRGVGKGTVSDFVHDSTMSDKWGFIPDYQPPANASPAQIEAYRAFNEAVELDQDLSDRFDAMPKDAQDVIKAMFRLGFDLRNTLREQGVSAINAEFDPAIEEAVAKNDEAGWEKLEKEKARALRNHSRIYDTRDGTPYAPLMRDGNWAVVGKSADFLAAEELGDQALIDELSQDPEHYRVSFVDGPTEARKLGDDYETKFHKDKGGGKTEVFKRDQLRDNPMIGTSNAQVYLTFSRMQKAIESKMDLSSEAKQAMQRMARDFYLNSVTEYSALKGELRRKKVSSENPVTGEKVDMMKAFVTRTGAMANFVSSMGHNAELQAALERMDAQTKPLEGEAQSDARRIVGEVKLRLAYNMGRQPNRHVTALLKGVSLWTLLTVPGYYVQNALQTFQASIPMLGSRFGYARAWPAMWKGYADFFAMTKDRGFADRTVLRNVPDDIKGLVEYLGNTSRLDAGFSEELGNWSVSGNGILPDSLRWVDRLTRRLPQYLETMNRATTGIAAYRLAKKQRPNMSEDELYRMAGEIIDWTQGDYSGFDAPSIYRVAHGFAGDASRIPLQFRRFQMNQAAMMVREFWRAAAGKSGKEKAEGATFLGYTLLHYGVLAGAVGLPGSELFGEMVLGLLNAVDDDDDKDWDQWRIAYREWLNEKAGDNQWLADFLYKGAPYAMGVDLSGKVGLGNVAALYPGFDSSEMKKVFTDPKELAGAVWKVLGGATGGIITRSVGSMDYGLSTGDWTRFITGLLPNVVGSTEKALRLKDEGLRGKGQETWIKPEDIGWGEALLVATGLTPAKLAQQSESANATWEAEQMYSKATTRLRSQLNAATLAERQANAAGDEAGAAEARARKAEVREAYMTLQDAKERDGFKRAPLSGLLSAPRELQRRQRRVTPEGVPYKKASKGFVEKFDTD